MRAVIMIAALAILASPAPSFAQETSDEEVEEATSDDGDAGEADDEEEEEDRGEAIRQGWSALFAAPDEHLWEFELGAGTMFWETAFGGDQDELYLRARGRKYLSDPFAASVSLDFTRQAPSAGTLEFREQRLALLASIDVHHWFGRWLLGLAAEAGPQWSRRAIDDATGEVDTSHRIDPTVGLVGRAGVSLFGTASLSLEGGVRWHPMRLDKLVVLQVGWLL